MKRVITAVLLIPPVAYLILLAHPLLFLGMVALTAVLCFHEYRNLASLHGLSTFGPFGYVAGLILLLVPGPQPLILVLLAAAALLLALRNQSLAKVLPSAASMTLGILYIFGAWSCAIGLRDANPHWLMFTLVTIWAADIAAYYTGRAFGRHRMSPRLSPNKTWEGSVGSVVASAAFGGAYLSLFVPGVSILSAVAVSVLANAAGQAGDLAESAIKRGAGVKDSGNLLPGHGGLLDRIDSTLFALPVVYFWLLQPWY